MTKRWIDDLQTAAQAGDADAQDTLERAGLWESPEDRETRERWETEARRQYEEEFGNADEECFFEGEAADFDSFADGEALASAGFGTDEDYGDFGYEEPF